MSYDILKNMSAVDMYNYCIDNNVSADDIFSLYDEVENEKFALQHEYDDLFQSGRYDYDDNSVNYNESTLNRMTEIEEEIDAINCFLNNNESCYDMLVYGV